MQNHDSPWRRLARRSRVDLRRHTASDKQSYFFSMFQNTGTAAVRMPLMFLRVPIG
jgi:hypothetical protein